MLSARAAPAPLLRSGFHAVQQTDLQDLRTCARLQPAVRLAQPASAIYHIDFRKDTHNPGKTFAPFRIIADGRSTASSAGSRLVSAKHHAQQFTVLAAHALVATLSSVLEQPHYRIGQTILLYLDPNIVAGEAEWKYSSNRYSKP